MRIINSLLFQLIFMAVVCIALSCQSQTIDQIKVWRIGSRVVVFEYVNVNVTAIESKNGIIIIDSHRSPATMNEIREMIEKDFGSNDFLYVINTHGDHDHCSGNQVFPQATIIGHDNCVAAMLELPANSPEMITYLKSHINDMPGEAGLESETEIWNKMLASIENEYKVTPPIKTFRDSLNLYLEDLTLKIIYCGNAHTDNDIFIYIPEEKLVFTGDIFTSKNSFGFSVNQMNDIQKVISVMDHILNDPAGVELIVPGHGTTLSRNEFLALRDLLKEKNEILQTKLSAAKLLESMIQADGIKTALQKISKIQSSEDSRYYYSEDEFSILGSRFLRKKLIDEAVGVFTQSIKVFPKSALGYDNLGCAYVKKGELDSAIIYYKKSLQLFPENKNTQDILKAIRLKRYNKSNK